MIITLAVIGVCIVCSELMRTSSTVSAWLLGEFFTQYPNPILEFVVTLLLAIIVIAVCLLVSKIIRMSSVLEYRLFGVKTNP